MRIVQDCEDWISPSGPFGVHFHSYSEYYRREGAVTGRTVSERERRSFIVNCACSNQAGFGLSGNRPSGNRPKRESPKRDLG